MDTVVARVIFREGDVADVGDGKGVTRWGQTLDWLEAHGLPVPESPEDAAENYRRWLDMTRLVEVCDANDALADSTIDYAVHSGDSRGIKALQAALEVRPDGKIGPVTVSAIRSCDRQATARRIVAARIRHVGAILSSDWQQARYAKGWLSRLAAQVEGLGA